MMGQNFTNTQRKHALNHDTPFCISHFIFYLISPLLLCTLSLHFVRKGERTRFGLELDTSSILVAVMGIEEDFER